MGDPVALQDIKGRVTDDSEESAYDLPITSRDEENVYTNIASSGETLADLTATEAKPGDIHGSKPEAKTAVSKKLYIFLGVLLTMLVILSVALGVITHILVSIRKLIFFRGFRLNLSSFTSYIFPNDLCN